MASGMASTPAPTIVFSRLITLLIHDACPITPVSFPLFGVRGRLRAVEGGLLGTSSADSDAEGMAQGLLNISSGQI